MQYIAKLNKCNLKIYNRNDELILDRTFKSRNKAIKYWDKFQKNNK